jgi:hypothetical protein
MKTILALLALAISLSAQPTPVKVAAIGYKTLPCNIRIENSGIYAISTFTVANAEIDLVTSDRKEAYAITDAGVLKKYTPSGENAASRVFSVESFHRDVLTLADHRDGSYSDASGKRMSLQTDGRNALMISSELSGTRKNIRLSFPGDLACAELIGIDSSGIIFLLTERYRSEIPLHIQREVLTIDAAGNRLSVLEIPDIKYLSTDKDFRIDAQGNLYHMMTTRDSVIVFQWPGLTTFHREPIVYPAEYSYSLHYNTFVTTAEAPAEKLQSPPQVAAISSRTAALHLAESYAIHQYTCTTANLSPSDSKAPDGDMVRTPIWLISGINARIPYMWGGYSTLAQFDAGLKSGNYAGDINTADVGKYSVGVDCSGFVSRCWQTSHNTTSSMPGISTQYASWDGLKPGDGILKNGHVRLFIERTANGMFRVCESSAREWDVSYWSYTASDLQGVYAPCSFNSMESNYSFQRPTLTSVLTGSGNNAALTWSCDTAGVLGYRIYSSADGAQWTLLMNESVVGNALKIVLPVSGDAAYYRVSSVKNDAPKTESDWSNAMGASRARGTVHYLIVDGFQRITGSWQSASNTFAVRYGTALKNAGVTFSTMKNYCSTADSASLSPYDGVIWYLGDEGTADETFSDQEQALLRTYLQNGKKLFVTGSEVGYDLSQNGTTTDKDFYSNYLKAAYKADNSYGVSVKSNAGGFYAGDVFTLGQIYAEDHPDEIDAANGSAVCLRYDNNRVAGVQYTGSFGASLMPGKLIYLSFALETTANDAAMNSMLKNAVGYFEGTTPVLSGNDPVPSQFQLRQNYPNPFNPSTTLSFTIPADGHATLKIFNVLGQAVATLVDGETRAGIVNHVVFNASGLASGIYFSRLEYDGAMQMTKLILQK